MGKWTKDALTMRTGSTRHIRKGSFSAFRESMERRRRAYRAVLRPSGSHARAGSIGSHVHFERILHSQDVDGIALMQELDAVAPLSGIESEEIVEWRVADGCKLCRGARPKSPGKGSCQPCRDRHRRMVRARRERTTPTEAQRANDRRRARERHQTLRACKGLAKILHGEGLYLTGIPGPIGRILGDPSARG
jgi:hypothetical protein